MPETEAIVTIIASTVTSLGVAFAGFAWVVRATVTKPLGEKIDRGQRLLARHTHDDDGEVVAPIVNGGQR